MNRRFRCEILCALAFILSGCATPHGDHWSDCVYHGVGCF